MNKNLLHLFCFIGIYLISFSVYATVCNTKDGIAWCEDTICWNKDGTTFSRTFCLDSNTDNYYRFNGSNCRSCPNVDCSSTSSYVRGKLAGFQNHNGYVLTKKGWCYYGKMRHLLQQTKESIL
ncbi:hypothetical protein BCR36DRAFT_582428 [Piromyces finnis]|uniref:Uncharacterized protein n=1 Tax=Piromyces finnis TaxID=1754191 RepID=A0A1Y1VD53_9FUNG|nr:hypothetical protein BCR36DRAFT_582428 [Piromyces finnis]|eukprot:ORX53039.1 hypothetical protein BCR36DRAFT_582428 [Piromyces finnis]